MKAPHPSQSVPGGKSRFLAAKFKAPPGAPASGWLSSRELKYRLYLPTGSSQRDSLPLIVMLHGCKQDPTVFAGGTRMNTLAEEFRCAVLYPEQSTHSNALRCWNWFESKSLAGQGEAELIAHLIIQVTRRRPIDARRVYIAGMSAGGAMACLLAVRHSQLFAACAIHSGVMYGAASSPAQALAAMRDGPSAIAIERARQLVAGAGDFAVTVPTLVIHGDRDPTVNPVNADHIVAQLRARIEEVISPGAGSLSPGGERLVESGGRTYRQQDMTRQGQVVLRQIMVGGLGHAWSGGDAAYDFNDANGPDASRLILDFVMAYERSDAPIAGKSP